MKTCSKCLIEKPLSEFFKQTSNKDGYRYNCKSCGYIYTKEYEKKNPDKKKASCKRYYSKNKLKMNADSSARYYENKEEMALYSKIYKKENSAQINAGCMKRHTNKLKRTPKWLTEDDHKFIELFYEESKRLTKKTGIKHNVDHIIPLQGKNVSGLHVPWNLQVITQTENFRKNNKF